MLGVDAVRQILADEHNALLSQLDVGQTTCSVGKPGLVAEVMAAVAKPDGLVAKDEKPEMKQKPKRGKDSRTTWKYRSRKAKKTRKKDSRMSWKYRKLANA